MPQTRDLTPQEQDWYHQRGVDPTGFKAIVEEGEQQQGTPSAMGTVGTTLKHGAGGILGGGAASLSAGALLAPWFAGPEAGIPADLLMAGGAAIAGLGGSIAGQKAQQALQSDETNHQQQAAFEQAQATHPWVTGATDIAASALASGGALSLSEPLKAVRGLMAGGLGDAEKAAIASGMKDIAPEEATRIMGQAGDRAALKNIALQSAVNPAINTGIQYATSGTLPSVGDLATQSIGGALFAGHGNPLAQIGHARPAELQEPLATGTTETGKTDVGPVSPWNERGEDGSFKLGDDGVRAAYLKASPLINKKGLEGIELAQATELNKQKKFMPTDDMRAALHTDWLEKQASTTPESGEPLKMVGADTVTTPKGEVEGKTTLAGPPLDTNQRAIDFVKHKEELQKQEEEAAKIGTKPLGEGEETVTPAPPLTKEKPITPNQARIINPATLLKSDVTRPEQVATGEGRELPVGHEATPEELAHEKLMEDRSIPKQPEDKKPQFIGVQKFGKTEIPLYNLKAPIVDAQGKVLHGVGSTVAEATLKKHGVDYSNPYAPFVTDADRNLGVSLPLRKAIVDGHATVGHVLHEFANTPGHSMRPLAKTLLKIASKKGLNIPVKYSGNPEGGMFKYQISLDSSITRPDLEHHIEVGAADLNNARTHMEEIVHGLTCLKIPPTFKTHTGAALLKHYEEYLANPKGDKAIKGLIQAHIDVAKARGQMDVFFGEHGVAGNAHGAYEELRAKGQGDIGYSMGNLHEFIAQAFKNEDFQRTLNKIPSSDNPTKSVWQSIKDAISSLLGIPVSQNHMLAKVLEHSSDLISQERTHENAIQEQRTGGLLQHTQEAAREAGSQRGGMEQSQQGAEHALPRKERQEGSLPVATDKGQVKETVHMGRVGRLTQAVLDKVKEVSKPIATAYKLALNDRDQLRGKYVNSTVESGQKLTPADKAQINNVMNVERSTGKLRPDLLTSQAQREFYQKAKQNLDASGKEAIARRIPVIQNGQPRLMQQDVSHWPMMANQRVEQVFRENTDQQKMASLEKEFSDWNIKTLKMTPAQSAERIDNWKQSIQGNLKGTDVSHQDHFNALRKAQGSPLPPSFREQNPVKNLARYFDRYSTAAAHYSNVESNHEVMGLLGSKKNAWGQPIPQPVRGSLANNPSVHAAIKQFHQEPRGVGEHTEQSVSSLVTSAFIANPGLEVHKLVSNLVKATSFADNPYQLTRALGHALMNIKSGYQTAKENGVVKLTASSVGDMFNGALTAAERMTGLAKGIRDVSTLNGLTTKVNAGLMQSFFHYLVPSKIQRANSGDTTAQQFLKRLDPTYAKGKQYSEVEQQQLASLAANYTHGTGDIRQMPSWMMGDSEVSGFFKLAHWSVAQTNNFMHDVWTPATNGNYAPLITSVFGSVAGGYIIKELREEIQGKKNPIPSLSEIAAGEGGLGEHKSLLAYNAIAAMQYSGFGGLLSQVAKYPFDFAYKNTPQGAVFPLDELASDLGETLKNVSTAIANDPNINWVDLATEVARHMVSNNIQLSRIAINQGINNGLITGYPAEKKSGGKINISMKDADRFLETYRSLFPEIHESNMRIQRQVEETRMLFNMFGFPYNITNYHVDDDMKDYFAWPRQSTVGEITRIAFSGLQQEIEDANLSYDILADTHDSYLVQSPLLNVKHASERMQNHMNIEMISPVDGAKFRMRSEVNIGFNWGPMKDSNPLGLREVSWLN